MSAADGWDELLAEAKQRLAEQEEGGELGESVTLEEGESFRGRFRGHGTAPTKRGDVGVLLVWDEDGRRRFFWLKTILQRELDELQPNVGDELAIVRGDDIPNADPERNPTQRFAVRARPCERPLPDDEPEPSTAGPGEPWDSDVPFMPA